MADPSTSETWDINAAADALFGADGGACVWVRNEEFLPRCAVRRTPKDAIGAAMLLASMQLGLADLTMKMATHYGIDDEQFAEMCDKAIELIAPKVDSVMRIKPVGPRNKA